MIKPLRRRHFQIWLALAVLLPCGIIGGWLVVPQSAKDHLLQPPGSQVLPLLIKTIDKINYTVNLRSSADTASLQLEWINKSPVTSPSALIYMVHDGEKEIEHADIVGRIDSRGAYYFPLKNDPEGKRMQLVLYDIIHHKIIDHIQF